MIQLPRFHSASNFPDCILGLYAAVAVCCSDIQRSSCKNSTEVFLYLVIFSIISICACLYQSARQGARANSRARTQAHAHTSARTHESPHVYNADVCRRSRGQGSRLTHCGSTRSTTTFLLSTRNQTQLPFLKCALTHTHTATNTHTSP